MANPQQPEVRRSERNPALSPDAMKAKLEAHGDVSLAAAAADNAKDPGARLSSGMQDQVVQDQPDLDDFAEAFGTSDPENS